MSTSEFKLGKEEIPEALVLRAIEEVTTLNQMETASACTADMVAILAALGIDDEVEDPDEVRNEALRLVMAEQAMNRLMVMEGVSLTVRSDLAEWNRTRGGHMVEEGGLLMDAIEARIARILEAMEEE